MARLPSDVIEFVFSICQDSQTPGMYGILSKETRAAADEEYWEKQCKVRGFFKAGLTYCQQYATTMSRDHSASLWAASLALLRKYTKPTAVALCLADGRLCLYFAEPDWYQHVSVYDVFNDSIVHNNVVEELLSAAHKGEIDALQFADVCLRSNMTQNDKLLAHKVKSKKIITRAWEIRRKWAVLVPGAKFTLRDVKVGGLV
jgi:hypothetical protein